MTSSLYCFTCAPDVSVFMEAKRVVFRKPVQTVTLAPTPNSAVQRKPIATPPAQHSFANDAHEHPCPHCGSSSPIEKVQERDRSGDVEAAQRRIADLEAEVKILNEKASNACMYTPFSIFHASLSGPLPAFSRLKERDMTIAIRASGNSFDL